MLLVDVNQYTRQSFHDNRIFNRARVPAGEPGRFDEPQGLVAGILAGASHQDITLDILFTQQKLVRNVLEGGDHLYVFANDLFGFLRGGSGRGHLDFGLLWWNKWNSCVNEQFSFECILYAFERPTMGGVWN